MGSSAQTASERDSFSGIRHLWKWLVEPPSRVQGPARRQSRLLGAGVVGLTVIFLAVDSAWLMTAPDYQPPYYGYAFLLACFLLNRLGRYALAATLVVAMFPIVAFHHVLTGESMSPAATLSYLALAPVVGSLLLRMPGVAMLTFVNVAGIASLPALAPAVFATTGDVIGPLSLNALVGVLVLFGIRHRDLIDGDRRAELEEQEARLRLALEAARMGIWDWDIRRDHAVTTNNVAEMLGYPDTHPDRAFERYLEAIHPDDRAEAGANTEKIRAGERDDLHALHRVVRADGSIRWVESRGRVVATEDGKPARMTGTIVDVTEKKNLEEQYRQAQKMEAIGRLAGGVAHDFNNLLTVIVGNVDALKQRASLPRLEEIDRAASSAASLTRQLLAVSRQAVLKPRVVDLNLTLKSTMRMLGRIIGEDVHTRLVPDENLWPTRVDDGQIQQIVLNLGTNARDAMPRGGELTVTTKNVTVEASELARIEGAGPGDYVMISVADSGDGMDDHTRSHAFEPFFTTKERGKGTGLGLSMVFGLVRQSGGFVDVESAVGRGSTFRLYFPRAVDPVDEQPEQDVGSSPGRRERVLLVEDEDTVRRVVARMLDHGGYDVIEASTPADALGLIEDGRDSIDLLLTDVVMPGMTGTELAEAGRQKASRLNVLFMTGYAPPEEEESMIDKLLQKPFTVDELLEKVREALSTPARRKRA